jgi:hypothetical protein
VFSDHNKPWETLIEEARQWMN